MKNICFFCLGHNGDIAHSKSFIKDIMSQLDVTYYFYHEQNFKSNKDLPLLQKYPHTFPNWIDHYTCKFEETEETLYINIWLIPWRSDNPDFFNINLKTFYGVFSIICERINLSFQANLKLKSIKDYFPTIDFDFVEKQNIDLYVNRSKNKKVLLCNGPCLSAQASYNGDMSDIIKKLSLEYSNIDFIATQKFLIDEKDNNIYFTEDIIQIPDGDLNEIGYLSTFCDLIVGRNSGPFCFSTLKENYNDNTKIFYAFGENENLFCFHGDIEIDAKFIYNHGLNEETIYDTIYNNLINYKKVYKNKFGAKIK